MHLVGEGGGEQIAVGPEDLAEPAGHVRLPRCEHPQTFGRRRSSRTKNALLPFLQQCQRIALRPGQLVQRSQRRAVVHERQPVATTDEVRAIRHGDRSDGTESIVVLGHDDRGTNRRDPLPDPVVIAVDVDRQQADVFLVDSRKRVLDSR